jgi:hypothetical protein
MPVRPTALIVILASLAVGCSHYPTDAELAEFYVTGTPRTELAAKFTRAPDFTATRAAAGWPTNETTPERIGAYARAFEERQGAIVQACDVYWIHRGPMGLGIWFDYVFYGADERLLGFRRRWVD